jgi:hypothetical protein
MESLTQQRIFRLIGWRVLGRHLAGSSGASITGFICCLDPSPLSEIQALAATLKPKPKPQQTGRRGLELLDLPGGRATPAIREPDLSRLS